MGVLNLWQILGPVQQHKELSELKGQVLAVDLSIWVCETQCVKQMQGVVPKPFLRNLFFRILHLLQLGVRLVFVVEGEAPDLKKDVMNKRQEARFQSKHPGFTGPRGRSKGGRKNFNVCLRECCRLLDCLGVPYLYSYGEAEALCAALDAEGLVDGCLTNDGDAFLYGARTVYRNFTMNTKDPHVESYTMSSIESCLGLDRQKMVAIALLLGCDYLPKGVPGVGVDKATKLLTTLQGYSVLERFHKWRHMSESECVDQVESLVRKKALALPDFPQIPVINEFLTSKDKCPPVIKSWSRPQITQLQKFALDKMDWVVEYTLEKVLPLVTLWDMTCQQGQSSDGELLQPLRIVKSRTRQGVQCYEVEWNKPESDTLSPQTVYTTIETQDLFSKCYPEIVQELEQRMAAKVTKVKSRKKKDVEHDSATVKCSPNIDDDLCQAVGNLSLTTDTAGSQPLKSSALGSTGGKDRIIQENVTPLTAQHNDTMEEVRHSRNTLEVKSCSKHVNAKRNELVNNTVSVNKGKAITVNIDEQKRQKAENRNGVTDINRHSKVSSPDMMCKQDTDTIDEECSDEEQAYIPLSQRVQINLKVALDRKQTASTKAKNFRIQSENLDVSGLCAMLGSGSQHLLTKLAITPTRTKQDKDRVCDKVKVHLPDPNSSTSTAQKSLNSEESFSSRMSVKSVCSAKSKSGRNCLKEQISFVENQDLQGQISCVENHVSNTVEDISIHNRNLVSGFTKQQETCSDLTVDTSLSSGSLGSYFVSATERLAHRQSGGVYLMDAEVMTPPSDSRVTHENTVQQSLNTEVESHAFKEHLSSRLSVKSVCSAKSRRGRNCLKEQISFVQQQDMQEQISCVEKQDLQEQIPSVENQDPQEQIPSVENQDLQEQIPSVENQDPQEQISFVENHVSSSVEDISIHNRNLVSGFTKQETCSDLTVDIPLPSGSMGSYFVSATDRLARRQSGGVDLMDAEVMAPPSGSRVIQENTVQQSLNTEVESHAFKEHLSSRMSVKSVCSAKSRRGRNCLKEQISFVQNQDMQEQMPCVENQDLQEQTSSVDLMDAEAMAPPSGSRVTHENDLPAISFSASLSHNSSPNSSHDLFNVTEFCCVEKIDFTISTPSHCTTSNHQMYCGNHSLSTPIGDSKLQHRKLQQTPCTIERQANFHRPVRDTKRSTESPRNVPHFDQSLNMTGSPGVAEFGNFQIESSLLRNMDRSHQVSMNESQDNSGLGDLSQNYSYSVEKNDTRNNQIVLNKFHSNLQPADGGLKKTFVSDFSHLLSTDRGCKENCIYPRHGDDEGCSPGYADGHGDEEGCSPGDADGQEDASCNTSLDRRSNNGTLFPSQHGESLGSQVNQENSGFTSIDGSLLFILDESIGDQLPSPESLKGDRVEQECSAVSGTNHRTACPSKIGDRPCHTYHPQCCETSGLSGYNKLETITQGTVGAGEKRTDTLDRNLKEEFTDHLASVSSPCAAVQSTKHVTDERLIRKLVEDSFISTSSHTPVITHVSDRKSPDQEHVIPAAKTVTSVQVDHSPVALADRLRARLRKTSGRSVLGEIMDNRHNLGTMGGAKQNHHIY